MSSRSTATDANTEPGDDITLEQRLERIIDMDDGEAAEFAQGLLNRLRED